jgi:hypothetical protein
MSLPGLVGAIFCSNFYELLETWPNYHQLIYNQACILSATIDSITICHVADKFMEDDLHPCGNDFIRDLEDFQSDRNHPDLMLWLGPPRLPTFSHLLLSLAPARVPPWRHGQGDIDKFLST